MLNLVHLESALDNYSCAIPFTYTNCIHAIVNISGTPFSLSQNNYYRKKYILHNNEIEKPLKGNEFLCHGLSWNNSTSYYTPPLDLDNELQSILL